MAGGPMGPERDTHLLPVPPAVQPGGWLRTPLPGYEPTRWIEIRLPADFNADSELEVSVPRLRESVYMRQTKRGPLLRFLCNFVPTVYLVFIWILVTANYVVVMCNVVYSSFRTDKLLPISSSDMLQNPSIVGSRAGNSLALTLVEQSSGVFPVWLVCIAHLLLLLQLVSFYRCQTTHPGAPPLIFGLREREREEGAPLAGKRAGPEEGRAGGYRRAVGGRLAAFGAADLQPIQAQLAAGLIGTCGNDDSVARGVRLCPRTGLQQPERAQWVANAGEMVLGLDHFCFWIGTPIGLRNRKFFILFLVYSALLCIVGAGFAAHEIRHVSTIRGNAFIQLYSEPGGLQQMLNKAESDDARSKLRVAALFAGAVHAVVDDLGRTANQGEGDSARSVSGRDAHVDGGRRPDILDKQLRNLLRRQRTAFIPASAGTWIVSAVLHASNAERWQAIGAIVCFVCDMVVGVILSCFTFWQVRLILRNATTLKPLERRYDVGCRRNWEQVFGRQPALWLLPVVGDGPAVDGLSWPLNPACKDTEGVP